MNLYVGNLSFETNEDELQSAFAPFGQITSATIIRDKFSGDSRGFGFVEQVDILSGSEAMDDVEQQHDIIKIGRQWHQQLQSVNPPALDR